MLYQAKVQIQTQSQGKQLFLCKSESETARRSEFACLYSQDQESSQRPVFKDFFLEMLMFYCFCTNTTNSILFRPAVGWKVEKEIYAKDDILCIKRGKESSIGSKIQIDIGRSGAINKKTHNFKLTNLFTGQVVRHRAKTELKEVYI